MHLGRDQHKNWIFWFDVITLPTSNPELCHRCLATPNGAARFGSRLVCNDPPITAALKEFKTLLVCRQGSQKLYQVG
jgi:hypothetical protein